MTGAALLSACLARVVAVAALEAAQDERAWWSNVFYAALADVVLLLHFGFVAFVVMGGVLVLRWRRLAWVHAPAVAWGVAVEYAGWICPLTPLENWLRQAGGGAAYAGGFVERYLVPVLYPAELTRAVQFGLGSFALLLNAFVYWRLVRTRRGRRTS